MPDPIQAEEIFIERNGRDLCIRRFGDPAATPIYFVHGISSHGGVWDDVALHLAHNGFQVIAPDRRGHGLSDHAESYSPIDYLTDFAAVTREIGRPGLVVGHCEGAFLAAIFAGALPEMIHGFLAIQFPIPPRAEPSLEDLSDQFALFLSEVEKETSHPVFGSLEEAAAISRQGTPFPAAPEVALKVARRNVKPCPGGVTWRWDPKIKTFRLLYGCFAKESFFALLSNINGPTRILYGESSSLMTLEKDRHFRFLSENLPRTQVELCPGDHFPHMSDAHAETIAEAIATSAG